MTEIPENKGNLMNNEINLLEVLRKIWAGRKTIYITTAVFFVIGFFYVIFSQKEYKSETTLIIENRFDNKGMSDLLQQFGGLSKLNMDKPEYDAITPGLYPEVIKSTPFLLEIMNQKVTDSKTNSTITITQYVKEYINPSIKSVIIGYTIGLPAKIIGLIRGKKDATFKQSHILNSDPVSDTDSSYIPVVLTSEQTSICAELARRIETSTDFKKNNKLSISIEMPDPLVAAQINSFVVKSLTRYIIEYRTKKAKDDLRFIIARHTEAKAKYRETQLALAAYRDRNKNIIMASVFAEEERLEAVYELAYDVYSTLSQQLEQSKIKVQENTPVFTVMEPANIPFKKSKPQTGLLLVLMTIIGLGTGAGIILVRSIIKNF